MVPATLLILSALFAATPPAESGADAMDNALQDNHKQDGVTKGRAETGGQSYGDRNRGGPYGFYSYPRSRHVDGRGGGGLDRRAPFSTSAGTSPWCDNCHGSAYYGRDYGAPYFGGGYYDRGVYYRERRER